MMDQKKRDKQSKIEFFMLPKVDVTLAIDKKVLAKSGFFS